MKLGNWNAATCRTLAIAQVSTTLVLNTAVVEHAHFILAQDRPFWLLICNMIRYWAYPTTKFICRAVPFMLTKFNI